MSRSQSTLAGALVALLALLGVPAHAEPKVLLLPALGSPAGLTVSGRVLKAVPKQGHSAFTRNLRRLGASGWPGAQVEVRCLGQRAQVVSAEDGAFEARFAPDGGASFPTGPSGCEARVATAQPGSATVEIVAPAAPFVVLSDFDDTLAITNVVDAPKLVQAALLQDEATQPVVPGMADFYRCLRADKPAPPGFALVSGSPLQYTTRVARFLGAHGFPFFGLYLRDLGPDTLHGYKQPILRALLQQLPNDVVLVGDSGEHDPEVYAEIRREAGPRVRAIYIRNAGRAADVRRFEDMVLFDQPAQAAADAVAKGLASRQCVEQAFRPGAAAPAK